MLATLIASFSTISYAGTKIDRSELPNAARAFISKYFAGDDIKKAEKVSGHCPSVDYLFESVAIHAKNNSIATILTGMGNDGAKGLLSIKNAGGYTIGQNKETCVVYGMPMAAKNIGAVLKEVPLEAIPNLIGDKFRTI